MLKKCRPLLSVLLALLLLIGSIPLSAAGENAESAASAENLSAAALQQADAMQVEHVFTSLFQWRDYLAEKNQAHQESDLTHESIQQVLREWGLAGLSKFQYYKLLTEETLGEFEPDKLLISFEGDHTQFWNPAFNALFESFTDHELFYACKLKKEYSREGLLALIGLLTADPYVAVVEPNFVLGFDYYPEDVGYSYSLTSAMEQVNAPRAWDYARGDGVKIGMLDTGVNPVSGQHLAAGSIADCTSSADYYGHGTAVSTVIGGNGAFTGVAPGCTIKSLGGCYRCAHIEDYPNHPKPSNFTEYLVDDMKWFTDNGYRVVNLSFADTGETVRSKFLDFITSNPNTLFVKSAGNYSENLDYDTEYTSGKFIYYDKPNFIRVAAVDRYDNLCSFSNYGVNTVHIAAPGQYLSLPTKGGFFDYFSGTSFSAPFVAGAAALLLNCNSNLTAAQLKNILLNTADVIHGLEGKVQGARRLNILEAVLTQTPSCSYRFAQISTGGELRVKEEAVDASWTVLSQNVKNAALEGVRVFYQLNNNHLYYRGGKLSNVSLPLDTTGNLVSFSASGDLLATYDGSTLKIGKYNYTNWGYDTIRTLTNVDRYSLSGNMLVWTYKSSRNTVRVYENVYNADQEGYMPESITMGSTNADVHGLFTKGSRIHIYYGASGYALYDYTGYEVIGGVIVENPMTLQREILKTNFSYNVSMDQTRWCYASGSTLYVYEWNVNGVPQQTAARTTPNGAAIEGVKMVGNRVFFLAGGHLYAIRENPATSDIADLHPTVGSFAAEGEFVGIVNTAGQTFLLKRGSLGSLWSTMEFNTARIFIKI
ncbi:MAG: hypothetical protein DBX52_01265 [Clostridiales bacterium]|nr:MAG: hypothetical protein DBX52_01265 [Clostridiales bacterium]